MDTNDKLLIEELRRDEGVQYSPYDDTVGIKTVGVGHNLKSKPLNYDYPLTDEQVDQVLDDDLQSTFDALDRKMAWWRSLSYVRQRVIANMAFNLGVDGLLGFSNTLAYVRNGDYKNAAENMLKSKWAKQVGQRAVRLSKMMAEG